MFKADSYEPIICDFGIAHFAEEELLTVIETRKGERMANFQYAAPEQRAKGKAATPQTDIFAAALVLNEMFTGEIPQAVDYKTIASVAPEYKFLDEVFSLLYRQEASDRLYPVEKILTEIKVRAERYESERKRTLLQNAITTIQNPEEFSATVIKKEYINNSIVLLWIAYFHNRGFTSLLLETLVSTLHWSEMNPNICNLQETMRSVCPCVDVILKLPLGLL